ncbi:hypothetical protein BIWAKO_04409 [Bosea sp. BIWAKO-01]|nr:hypothetical protein BIWAKO_04409 [Bosea sp. BIWAKO-01]
MAVRRPVQPSGEQLDQYRVAQSLASRIGRRRAARSLVAEFAAPAFLTPTA